LEGRHVVTDDLPAPFAIPTIATQGLPQQRETGLMLHEHCQHHVGEVGAMLPTSALGEGHDRCVRRRRAVIAAIDRETRRLERAERGRQPQTRGGRGGNEAVECRPPKIVEGIEGAPAGVIMEMAGLNAWGKEARERLGLEQMGDEVERLVEQAETVEPHGFDRMAGGHNPHGRVLLRRLINDRGDAECCKHAGDETQVS
jgi:hypothetical protein